MGTISLWLLLTVLASPATSADRSSGMIATTAPTTDTAETNRQLYELLNRIITAEGNFTERIKLKTEVEKLFAPGEQVVYIVSETGVVVDFEESGYFLQKLLATYNMREIRLKKVVYDDAGRVTELTVREIWQID